MMRHHTAEHEFHHRLPPEHFLWGLLEVPAAVGSRNPSVQQLEYLFEPMLPVPVEHVHTVFQKLDDGRYVACAMLKDRLSELLAAEQSSITILTPSRLPGFINAEIKPLTLNLLTREFEPPTVKQLRRRWLVHSVTILFACSLLITVGFELRARQLLVDAQATRERQNDLFAEVLGPNAATSRQPPELQLRALLRQLRQTRSSSIPLSDSTDVSEVIAALLAEWPSEDAGESPLYMRTELISVTPAAITVRGLLPESSDAQRFADHVRHLENWQLREPQVVATSDAVQMTLQFTPEDTTR